MTGDMPVRLYTSRTARCDCPHCGTILTAATGTGESVALGDITICIHCARPSVFDIGLVLRKPTKAEAAEIAANELAQQFIASIREVHNQQGE